MRTLLRVLGETLRAAVEWWLAPLPGPPGYLLRWCYYKLLLGKLGWATWIDVGVRFENPRRVFLGSRCWIDRNVLLLGGVEDPLRGRPGRWVRRDPALEGRLVVGDGVHVGPNCVLSGLAGLRVGSYLTIGAGSTIYSLSHHPTNLDSGEPALFTPRARPEEQYLLAGPVEIADGTGVGAGSKLWPGARLRPGSFLAAGSSLAGDTEEGFVYAGSPARPQRPRRRA